MKAFETKHLPMNSDAVAPGGSFVRLLLGLKGGGMAHFELETGQVSKAVSHKTVEEIWYFLSGGGQMWRSQNGKSEIVDVYEGVSLSIPLGTRFQFRSFGFEPLSAISVSMPPGHVMEKPLLKRVNGSRLHKQLKYLNRFLNFTKHI